MGFLETLEVVVVALAALEVLKQVEKALLLSVRS